MILRISEACQDQWPLVMNDYTPYPRDATVVAEVKITIRSDLFPRLFKQYQALPTVGRGAIILNMLNRHVELSMASPDLVEAELARQNGVTVKHTGNDGFGGAGETSTETSSGLGPVLGGPLSPSEPPPPDAATQLQIAPLEAGRLPVPAPPEVIEHDPLQDMDCGL